MQNKLLLNFFGEKVDINIPPTLTNLQKTIASKFSFDPSEVAELVLFYVKDLGKKIVKTEQDFVNFIKSKVPELNLDIPEQSKLYKEQMEVIQKQDLLSELEVLKMEKLSLKEEISKKKEANTKLVQEKKKAIENLKKDILNIKKENQKEIEKHNLLLKEKDKQIAELEQKLGIKKVQPQPKIKPIIQDKQPKIQKPKPKLLKKAIIPNQAKLPNTNEIFQMMKDNLQKYLSFDVQIPGVNEEHQLETPTGNEKPSSKLVHKNVKCDGCGAFPIEGIRYKCAVCRDFDYCEKCEQQFCENEHCHPFIKINKPELKPGRIYCYVKDNVPDYQKKMK